MAWVDTLGSTQSVGSADALNLLKGLFVEHEDGILVATGDINFVAMHNDVVRRTAEALAIIGILIDVLLDTGGIRAEVHEGQASIDTGTDTAVVDDQCTTGGKICSTPTGI